MAQPLVSILMTAYNREKYIASAIDSVLASTYANFELIIVDDKSKDKTIDIAKSFEVKDNRVKVFINESNLGDYPNRNKAASYATGKYLKYVDADDYIYPWGLSILVESMEKFPGIGWGLCSLDQQKASPYPILLSPKEAYEYHYQGRLIFNKAPLSSIIKSEIFWSVGGFPEKRMTSDFELWHMLAQKYPLLLMPKGIVWYREHDDQEINSMNRFFVEYEQIKIKYLSDINCPLDKNFVQQIKKKRKIFFLKTATKKLMKFSLNEALLNLKLSKLYR